MLFNSMKIGAKQYILEGGLLGGFLVSWVFQSSICENVVATETDFQGAKFYETPDGTLSQFSKNYAIGILLAWLLLS